MCPVSTAFRFALSLVPSLEIVWFLWAHFAFVHTRRWKMKCESANLIRSLMLNSTLKAYGCSTLKQTPL